ncbi:DUF302 domain-containing protein [Cupriavidus sp. SZY C1]|uniref:DUF302 domain-containing protein n=1 Tax=Cupriavidus sp. SZY C1 TaxID=3055037 RepID=UPI0028B2E02B|nr:DUF302 domain-containing protein [Cupriavidus sp. SZY C1]MDT6961494.1 DUF302 domain-containing protein [Cupriavidus sp. SZY C1]
MMSTIVQKSLSVTHVSEVFEIAPDAFCRQFEQQLRKLDHGALELMYQDPAAAEARMAEMEGPHGLMLFDKLDHGVLFALGGEPRVSFRYHIGNPLVAWRMTRHDMRAALYAPLTLLVFGNGDHHTQVEYDLPSSLFGQFGDAVGTVGKFLDEKLRAIFSALASQEAP